MRCVLVSFLHTAIELALQYALAAVGKHDYVRLGPNSTFIHNFMPLYSNIMKMQGVPHIGFHLSNQIH